MDLTVGIVGTLKKCLVGNVYPKGFFEDYEDKRVADALSKVNEDPREDIQNSKTF